MVTHNESVCVAVKSLFNRFIMRLLAKDLSLERITVDATVNVHVVFTRPIQMRAVTSDIRYDVVEHAAPIPDTIRPQHPPSHSHSSRAKGCESGETLRMKLNVRSTRAFNIEKRSNKQHGR